jgi:hypothetical protein
MTVLLPGTEVQARGLRWEVVFSQSLGTQTLYRLRGLHGAFKGQEVEFLAPFETIKPTYRELDPDHAAPIRNWLVYHQAFLLEQALGPSALLSIQPGRLRLEAYQLVPVLRAIRMSRVRLLLADSVGLGKTVQAGLVLTELMARRPDLPPENGSSGNVSSRVSEPPRKTVPGETRESGPSGSS